MLDPRIPLEQQPEFIQKLMRGELPAYVPNWLKVEPHHPALGSVVEFEPDPVVPEPELTKREQYQKDHPDEQ